MTDFACVCRCLALLVAVTAAPSHAATVALELPGTLDQQSVNFTCRDGDAFVVTYYNLPDTQIAVLPIEGTPRAFVAVMAASGAKYVSGPHVWWTRGSRGDLYDETRPDADPNLCQVAR